MKFENVCIESLAVALPEEVWSSAAIEERLRPLYERLKLPVGRLELMSGIRERRMWPTGTRPSDASAQAGRAVLAKSALGAERVELFVHAAVSRDMLEPATASFAHRKIGLPSTAQIFDLSNACLGFLNALTVAAGLIESGQIRCALVVSGENGRPLVEQTVQTLLRGIRTSLKLMLRPSSISSRPVIGSPVWLSSFKASAACTLPMMPTSGAKTPMVAHCVSSNVLDSGNTQA